MITEPMDILNFFPIRKSKKQKQAFRDAVIPYAEGLGYKVTVEKGSMGAQNIIIGNPDTAKYLVTAHYDTPASIGLPNFITPCNFPVFLIYQILVVGVFFLAAFVAGLLVSFFTDDSLVIFWAAYIAYFGLLFLMMFGPANRNNANDNTSGVVTLLQIAASIPQDKCDHVCFVLFDLEEAGLIGSAAYRKAHKAATDKQIILNLDCVGDGDEIVLFPTSKLRKDASKLNLLEHLVTSGDKKQLRLHRKGFAYCPSDHGNFPYGVGIMAFHRMKGIGIYCDRIHTWRDTILEEENVLFLRDALLRFITEN